MTLLNARNLSLEDVQRLLGFEEDYNDSFASLLSLEALTEFEQQELFLQSKNPALSKKPGFFTIQIYLKLIYFFHSLRSKIRLIFINFN